MTEAVVEPKRRKRGEYDDHQVFSLSYREPKKRRGRPKGAPFANERDDLRPASHRCTPIEVGQSVIVLNIDGQKHPHLEGKRGRVVHIRKRDNMPFIEIEGVGTFPAVELWWKRIE